ncbi:MAG: hypothetical protein WD025_08525 [Bacteriovoracaceae bacterium]
MNVKVRGVYDLDLFRYLRKAGINHFAFDLRPASFNFVQMRKIIEMLQNEREGKETFSFMFASEKDFVIEQLMVHVRRNALLDEKNCYLEFTDSENLAECEKFGLPYIWHFKDSFNYRKIRNSKSLSGVSFSYEYLESLRESNQLYPFIKEFINIKREDQWIDLRLDWSDHLSESVTDFMPAQVFSYEINQKVEESYRRVDMNLVGSHLEHAKRILNLDA